MAHLALAFIDPFDRKVDQVKLYDGHYLRSHSVKLRTSGRLTLKSSEASYVILHPGINNSITWRTADAVDATNPNTPPPYTSHASTTADRGGIHAYRLINAGVRFMLMNSSDENEGYFEAVRFQETLTQPFFNNPNNTLSLGDGAVAGLSSRNWPDNPSYQTGKLRDIHKYLFRLNNLEEDPNFSSNLVDNRDFQFDFIMIRFWGRTESTSPSILMYETACNQEVVYKDGTALARTMTAAPHVPAVRGIYLKTRAHLPGILR